MSTISMDVMDGAVARGSVGFDAWAIHESVPSIVRSAPRGEPPAAVFRLAGSHIVRAGTADNQITA
jgi:hypothetical protein